ncbi:MAG: protein translocase subunit SecD [Brevinema sp.]
MNKLFRYLFLLAVSGFAAWGLYPTYVWYVATPVEDRALIGMTPEELETADIDTKEYVQSLKKTRQKTLSLGLDLQGGVYVAAVPDEDDLREQLMRKYDQDEAVVEQNFEQERQTAVTRALQIIKNRIDAFGVAEPAIRPTYDNKITIELPGVSDPNLLKDGLSKVGKLTFRFVDATTMNELQRQGVPYDGRYGFTDRASVPTNFILPDTAEWVSYWENDTTEVPQLKGWYLLQKQVDLDGTMIKSAQVTTDNLGRNVVAFELDDEGTAIFADITRANVGRQFAIVLDDRVRSAPVIQSEIAGGRGQITGSFGFTEATYLATVLQAGALPVRLNIIEERVIGPQLGEDSIKRGLQALVFGAIAVILFILFWYRGYGIVATLALLFNVFFLVSLLASIGATLTLSGLAGIALTVGMAVDANIIIYERIKEESRLTHSYRAAFFNAFDHAGSTIWDSNLTTLVAAIALSVFGSGSIKGFGVTLAFGIIANIFTSLFITKLLLESFLKRNEANFVKS